MKLTLHRVVEDMRDLLNITLGICTQMGVDSETKVVRTDIGLPVRCSWSSEQTESEEVSLCRIAVFAVVQNSHPVPEFAIVGKFVCRHLEFRVFPRVVPRGRSPQHPKGSVVRRKIGPQSQWHDELEHLMALNPIDMAIETNQASGIGFEGGRHCIQGDLDGPLRRTDFQLAVNSCSVRSGHQYVDRCDGEIFEILQFILLDIPCTRATGQGSALNNVFPSNSLSVVCLVLIQSEAGCCPGGKQFTTDTGVNNGFLCSAIQRTYPTPWS